jgi:outer membrane lipoprotein-sorting protein
LALPNEGQPGSLALMRSLIALTVAAWLYAPGFAAEPRNAEEVLALSLQKSAAYKSFSADFTQTMNMGAMSMKLEGRVYYKQPALMRMEVQMPLLGETQTILAVLDADNVMWQQMYLGQIKRVIKMDMTKIARNGACAGQDPFQQFDPNKQLADSKDKYNYTLLGTQTLAGNRVYILEGRPRPDAKWTPQEAALANVIGKSRVHIGAEDGFLRKIEQLDTTGTNVVMTMEFTNVKFNEEFPPEFFVYRPAPDEPVVDMTDIAAQLVGSPPTNTPATPPPLPGR